MFRVKEFNFRPLPASVSDGMNVSNEHNHAADNDDESLVLKDVLRSPEASRHRAIESVWNIDGELLEKSDLHVKYVICYIYFLIFLFPFAFLSLIHDLFVYLFIFFNLPL